MENKIYAKCIQASDEDCSWLKHDLEVGKLYEVKDIYMGQSNTSVYLKEMDKCYNSVYLEFYENGEVINIFDDTRFNPYL